MANAFTLVLVVSGVATAGAIIMFLAPRFSVRALFGEEITDDVAILVARHWGLLVFLVGALLIAAAYDPLIRVPIAVAGAIEKAMTVKALGKPCPAIPARGGSASATPPTATELIF